MQCTRVCSEIGRKGTSARRRRCRSVGRGLGGLFGLHGGPIFHAIIDKCLALSDRLLTLIDEDAANFEPLSRAYGLPANTEEEKAQKERVLQDATKIAASGPIEMVDLIYEAILLQEKLVNLSTKMILSDVGCGAEMLRAALLSAKLNVVVNLASITDAAYVAEVRKNVNRKVADGTAICDRVFDQVLTTLQK